jgi:hypothetical protein
MRGLKGSQRIGNNRSTCSTCNTFVQAVRRLAFNRMRETYPKEFEAVRLRVELDLYPQVIDRFTIDNPLSGRPAGDGEES